MNRPYNAPELEVLSFVSDRTMASMNFGDLKDAAHDGNNGNGAIEVDPTLESFGDIVVSGNK